jgi:hypothetical protein
MKKIAPPFFFFCASGLNRTKAQFAARCISAGALLLLVGLGFYLTFRSVLPAPLERLGFKPHALGSTPANGVLQGSLPSLIHAAAFSLFSCAVIGPSVRAAFIFGAIWAGVDTLWEFSCANHQSWIRAALQRVGAAAPPPQCIYDGADIVAAFAGAAAATVLVIVFIFLNSSAGERLT